MKHDEQGNAASDYERGRTDGRRQGFEEACRAVCVYCRMSERDDPWYGPALPKAGSFFHERRNNGPLGGSQECGARNIITAAIRLAGEAIV